MFKSVHHVHYLVHNRDEIVDYMDKTFGLKPTDLIEHRGLKEALYDIEKTQIQFTEPLDPTSDLTEHLAKHGPGVWHVAWGVDDIQQVAKDLAAKGNKLRGAEGAPVGPLGYRTINLDRSTSHGLIFQLAEGPRKLKR